VCYYAVGRSWSSKDSYGQNLRDIMMMSVLFRRRGNHVGGVQGSSSTNLVIAGGARRSWARLKRSFNKRPEFVLVRSNAQIDDAVDECQTLRPCVLLVDFESVASVDRPDDFAQKLGFGRTIPVLVLIEEQTSEAIESMLRMGLMGFLRTDSPPWQIRRAVQAIVNGEVWAPRKLLSRVFQDSLAAGSRDKLTARELEILTFVTQGYSNKETANALCISRETVRWHIRTLYGKLGIHDRKSAVLHGLRQGLDKRNLSSALSED
jgi:DNA-binding NarL/FixJ family response regulator